MSKKYILGIVFVFLSAVIFGFTPVLANLSYSGGNNGVNMAFLRALLPLPVLFALGWGRGKRAKPTAGQIRRGILVEVFKSGKVLACTVNALESQDNRVKIDADIENAEQDQRITDQGIHKQIILEASKPPFFPHLSHPFYVGFPVFKSNSRSSSPDSARWPICLPYYRLQFPA